MEIREGRGLKKQLVDFRWNAMSMGKLSSDEDEEFANDTDDFMIEDPKIKAPRLFKVKFVK